MNSCGPNSRYQGTNDQFKLENLALCFMEKLRISGQLSEETFSKYDPECNGYITRTQFVKVIESMGIILEEHQIEDLIESVDILKNKCFNYLEFIMLSKRVNTTS